ncbi:hypothetical protein CP970_09865 [Streptomyces kanamyceticus]|uniref:Uncharacterized protein n=1 Tax=Streptomyces kanamyceticus TaxID=1967 RepID=A0A5J6G868_STRKN|nr:hypothetical protein CP970_09865 [Streptomyces kanamyceticus]
MTLLVLLVLLALEGERTQARNARGTSRYLRHRALVEDGRHVGTNDSGSYEIAYRLSWREGEATRYVDDAHIRFVFTP